LRYLLDCAFRPAGELPAARAAWLQYSSRRVLRIFGASVEVVGQVPASGLLVCNHLSYMDVLVLAALSPCCFVAKSEVKHWPLLGWFSQCAGTIFVDRQKRARALATVNEIETALDTGVTVVVFPEGTSSGGQTILPFKSSLLEPAVRNGHSTVAGLLAYELEQGNVVEEVCYWKNMTLVPHLVNLLSKTSLRASACLARVQYRSANRKEFALHLHSELSKLKYRSSLTSHENKVWKFPGIPANPRTPCSSTPVVPA